MQQGLAALQAMEAELFQPQSLALLAEAYGKEERTTEKGLAVLTKALATVDKTGEHYYEAELYRLKGQVTLQSKVQGPRGRGVFSEGNRNCSSAAGKVVRAAGNDKPEPAVAAPGQEGRSATAAGRDLWLVH